MNRANTLLLSLLIALILFACGEAENAKPASVVYYGHEYFPAKTGYSWTYTVDTSAFNKLADTTIRSSYFMRMEIDSVFFRNATDTTYRVNIYTTPDSAKKAFKLKKVFQLTLKPLKVIYNAENFPIVKLLIPFYSGLKWEGNEFNNLVNQKPSFQVSVNELEQIATVTENNDSSCLGINYSTSKYLKSVGLTLYTQRFVEFVQDPLNPCASPLVINNERKQTYKLLYMRKP